jgi:hypothetical protein
LKHCIAGPPLDLDLLLSVAIETADALCGYWTFGFFNTFNVFG